MEYASMFTLSMHPFVGRSDLTYLPSGTSPYAPHTDSQIILHNGDTVTVLSAWNRDYLDSPPILLYVESHRTGQRTHVVADDLLELLVN